MKIYSFTDKQGYEGWGIDYVLGGQRFRKRIGVGKKGKRAAELSLKKLETQIYENRAGLEVRRGRAITFNEFKAEYLKRHGQYKLSKDVEKYFLESLSSFFGNIPLHQITYEMIERYQRQRAAKASVGVNRELFLLRSLFNKATRWNSQKASNEEKWLVPVTNPISGIRFQPETPRDRYLTDDEIKKVLSNAESEQFKDVFLLALNTGMRKGEIQNIAMEDMDFEHGTILIPQNKTKSLGSSNRSQSVPMNGIVKKILLKYHSDKAGDAGTKPFDYNFRKAFETAVTRAKINDVHFHDTRHTAATLLYKVGVDLYTIARLLRHTIQGPIQITAIYTAVLDQTLHDAVCKLERYFEGVVFAETLQNTRKVGKNPANARNGVWYQENYNDVSTYNRVCCN
ncbi:MAG TPA: site-specific integrase [Candidatus Omnitrophota bacterium]|jgi:integrase|nr:site-specific integrase [Candidatus Omnitrophota bacterium]